MVKTLTDLGLGQEAIITKVTGSGAIRRRMIDLGIVPGMEVRMERYAPLGDPIEIKLKGCHVSLRKKEAENVLIKDVGGVPHEA